MHKIWIMGLKQHNIIKWKCFKNYCLSQFKDKATNVKKYKGQLQMMEDEQNLKKITGKGTRGKTSKNAGKPQTQVKKNKWKNTRLTSI